MGHGFRLRMHRHTSDRRASMSAYEGSQSVGTESSQACSLSTPARPCEKWPRNAAGATFFPGGDSRRDLLDCPCRQMSPEIVRAYQADLIRTAVSRVNVPHQGAWPGLRFLRVPRPSRLCLGGDFSCAVSTDEVKIPTLRQGSGQAPNQRRVRWGTLLFIHSSKCLPGPPAAKCKYGRLQPTTSPWVAG